jgi:hypothetical protein
MPPATALARAVFFFQTDRNALKLVRGFYILVPLFDKETAPKWSSYELRRLAGRLTLTDRGGLAAPLEHILLGVDYAA